MYIDAGTDKDTQTEAWTEAKKPKATQIRELMAKAETEVEPRASA